MRLVIRKSCLHRIVIGRRDCKSNLVGKTRQKCWYFHCMNLGPSDGRWVANHGLITRKRREDIPTLFYLEPRRLSTGIDTPPMVRPCVRTHSSLEADSLTSSEEQRVMCRIGIQIRTDHDTRLGPTTGGIVHARETTGANNHIPMSIAFAF